jgi:hypothetical protein
MKSKIFFYKKNLLFVTATNLDQRTELYGAAPNACEKHSPTRVTCSILSAPLRGGAMVFTKTDAKEHSIY